MSDRSPALSVEGIAHRYGRRTVLDNLSFEIRHGERIAIVGASGAGKSTLLNLIAAFEEPDQGVVRYAAHGAKPGVRIGRGEMRAACGVRKRIGFVFQSAPMMESRSAIENVALPLRLDGVSPHLRLARAREIAERLGLGSRILACAPRLLSAGERQRVAIARAVVRDPVLVVADEPTGNLDPARSADVESLLSEVTKARGRALLLVTHDLALAHRSADRVLVLRDGKLFEPCADIRERGELSEELYRLSMVLARKMGMVHEMSA